MQGAWGWGTLKPHSSKTLDDGPWQGQWENNRSGEASGWDTGTWDQLSKGESSHYEEFENVMRWDDSGAQEAFETAKKIQEGNVEGFTSSLSLPSPDLYIQAVDWDSREDLKLPDSAENFSEQGERTGHRKRGRKGGAFRRQFDRQDPTSAADWKQNGKAFLNPVSVIEGNPHGDHTLHHGSSNTPMLDVGLDASQRESVPCQQQSPVQDHVRSNWAARWSSQPPRRQNFTSSNWQDHGRSNNWEEGYNPQPHRWPQQTNASFEPVRGWGRGGVPQHHHSSHGLPNDLHYQSTPVARNLGNEWMSQGGANGRGFQRRPMEQFDRGFKEQHHGPRPFPDNSRRWRQQQRPYHPWQ